LLNTGFDDANAGSARLFLDTCHYRDKLCIVSTTVMVHSPIHDDALYPDRPDAPIQRAMT
jgi:hypothetical protein